MMQQQQAWTLLSPSPEVRSGQTQRRKQLPPCSFCHNLPSREPDNSHELLVMCSEAPRQLVQEERAVAELGLQLGLGGRCQAFTHSNNCRRPMP